MAQDFAAVLFDAGHTLLRLVTSVGEVYASEAARYGIQADPQALDEAFDAIWRERNSAAWEIALYGASEDEEFQWWRETVALTFARIGKVENLGNEFDPLIEDLNRIFVSPDVWEVFEDVRPTLDYLVGRGVRCAVVSNWDTRLSQLLSAVGLRPYFDFVLTSAEAGYRKPSRQIFHQAIARLDLPRGRVMHVGDTPEDDIRGATGAGLTALLVDRDDVYPAVKPRIASLTELRRWFEA